MTRYSLLLRVVLCGWTGMVLAAQESPAWGNFATLSKEVERIPNIQYAQVNGIKLSLDLYQPRQEVQGKLPVVVWIHGGAWMAGSKEYCTPLWLGFVQKGYALASVQYRLTDKAPYPAQIEDCKAAVRWLRAHAEQYNLDVNRFAAWGESAGGHLVALLATTGDTKEFDIGDHLDQSSAVQAVCDYYGPTSFVGAASMANDENASKPDSVLYKLFGGPLSEKQDVAAKASPVTFVSKGDAPILIVHGTKDGLVPLRQSIVFHELLQKAGVDSVYYPIEGANHGGAEFATPEVVTMIDEFFKQHLSKSKATLSSPKPSIDPVLKDIPYRTVGDKTLCLDLYRPEQSSGKLPVIVWIHGGAWLAGSKSQCLPERAGFVKKGFAVASVDYRLTDAAKFPAQIEDCKAAIRWLRAHAEEYNLDANRFAAWGDSAGGHLVGLLGTTGDIRDFDTGENLDQSSAVQVVCDYYGPSDFAAFVTTPGYEDHAEIQSPESRLIGGRVQDKSEEAKKASPTSYASKGDAPMLLVHGDKDTVVPIGQSKLLYEALQKAGVESVYHPILGASHGGAEFATPEIIAMIDDFFKKHLSKSDTPLSSPTPSTEPVLKDIPYCTVGDKTLCLDLYRPEEASGKLPVIVWIHGGGWREGSKNNCLPARLGFVDKGFAVASVEYRMTDAAIFPAQIEDCKAAIRWLRAHADQYNLDADRFAAWGSSAGGHLVALLGTTGEKKEFDTGENLDQSSVVQVVCDYYGPTDFTSFVSAKGFEDYAKPDSVVSKLLGGQASDNPDKAQNASPMMYVSKGDAPILLIHGDKDTIVPLEQSQMLYEALKKVDVPTEFVTLKDAGHGGPQFQTPELISQIEAFLKSHLDKAKAGTN